MKARSVLNSGSLAICIAVAISIGIDDLRLRAERGRTYVKGTVPPTTVVSPEEGSVRNQPQLSGLDQHSFRALPMTFQPSSLTADDRVVANHQVQEGGALGPEPDVKQTSEHSGRELVEFVRQFSNLSVEGEQRLLKLARLRGSTDGNEEEGPSRDSLTNIIGEDAAERIKIAVQEAFANSRNQHLEKEVLLISRHLQLRADQELQVRSIISKADAEMDESALYVLNQQNEGNTEAPIANIRALDEWRQVEITDKLKEVLTNDQYNAFLDLQSTPTVNRAILLAAALEEPED